MKKLSEFVVNPFRATTVFVETVTRVLSSCVLDAFTEDALAPAVILSSVRQRYRAFGIRYADGHQQRCCRHQTNNLTIHRTLSIIKR